MEEDSRDIVIKDNQLVTAHYRLSVKAQLLLVTLIAKINPRGDKFQRYTFKLDEIYHILGVHNQNKKVKLKALYKALKELQTSLVKVVDFSESGKKRFKPSPWVESPVIAPDENFITLRPAETLMPLLIKLHKHFTRYNLRDVLSFRNPYSFRFYEFCKNKEPRSDYNDRVIEGRYVNEVVFTVEELRQILQIPANLYAQFGHFKNRIIKAAQKEINGKTSAFFEFDVLRDRLDGRKAIGFKLRIFGSYVTTRPPEETENPNPNPLTADEQELRLRMVKLGVTAGFQDVIFGGVFEENKIKAALEAVEEWHKNLKKRRRILKNPARALEAALTHKWLSRQEEERRRKEDKIMRRKNDDTARQSLKKGLAEHQNQKNTQDTRLLEEYHRQAIVEEEKLIKKQSLEYEQAADKTGFVFDLVKEKFADIWRFSAEQEELLRTVTAEKIKKGSKFADIRFCLVIEIFRLNLPDAMNFND